MTSPMYALYALFTLMFSTLHYLFRHPMHTTFPCKKAQSTCKIAVDDEAFQSHWKRVSFPPCHLIPSYPGASMLHFKVRYPLSIDVCESSSELASYFFILHSFASQQFRTLESLLISNIALFLLRLSSSPPSCRCFISITFSFRHRLYRLCESDNAVFSPPNSSTCH